MEMSWIDQAKCADIYYNYTGIETEPSWWNEEAGDLLAEMVYKIEECTNGMDDANCFLSVISKGLRSILNPSSPTSWQWVVSVPAHRLKKGYMLKQGFVNTACLNEGLRNWKDQITYALVK